MRKSLIILLVIIGLAGCGLPYQGAVMNQLEYAGSLNRVTNELGSALSRGEEFGPVASREIREALDEQREAEAIAIYALEQYRVTNGMLGTGSLEVALSDLKKASEKIEVLIHKYAAYSTAPLDEDVGALMELYREMSGEQRDQLIKIIGE